METIKNIFLTFYRNISIDAGGEILKSQIHTYHHSFYTCGCPYWYEKKWKISGNENKENLIKFILWITSKGIIMY